MSSVLKPELSKKEFNALPRKDRIWQSILFPKHFQLSDQDESYFRLMRMAYNILLSATTDQHALQLIRIMDPEKTLTLSEVVELITETKEFFGRMVLREERFERVRARHRLEEYIVRCQAAGDLKNERLALLQLDKLDDKEFREAQTDGPVIPDVPDVFFISDIEEAEVIEEEDENGDTASDMAE